MNDDILDSLHALLQEVRALRQEMRRATEVVSATTIYASGADCFQTINMKDSLDDARSISAYVDENREKRNDKPGD